MQLNKKKQKKTAKLRSWNANQIQFIFQHNPFFGSQTFSVGVAVLESHWVKKVINSRYCVVIWTFQSTSLIYIYIYVYIYIYIYIYIVCIYIHIYIYIYIYEYVYMYKHGMCIYICIYICVQDDQLELTHSSYVRTQDVTLKTGQRRWIIERSGERESGISVLVARHDDDDDDDDDIYV